MTHAQAVRRRRAHVPPSDCPGELVYRALRPKDWALRCTACGLVLWLDREGTAIGAARNGTPIVTVDRDV